MSRAHRFKNMKVSVQSDTKNKELNNSIIPQMCFKRYSRRRCASERGTDVREHPNTPVSFDGLIFQGGGD